MGLDWTGLPAAPRSGRTPRRDATLAQGKSLPEWIEFANVLKALPVRLLLTSIHSLERRLFAPMHG